MWYLGSGQHADKVQICSLLDPLHVICLWPTSLPTDLWLLLLLFSPLRLMEHKKTVLLCIIHLIVHTSALWDPKTFSPSALGFSVYRIGMDLSSVRECCKGKGQEVPKLGAGTRDHLMSQTVAGVWVMGHASLPWTPSFREAVWSIYTWSPLLVVQNNSEFL